MQPEHIRNALVDFVEGSSGLSKVLWSNQELPRSYRTPWASLHVDGDDLVASPATHAPRRDTASEAWIKVFQTRFTLSVHTYGPDAGANMRKIRKGLFLTNHREHFICQQTVTMSVPAPENGKKYGYIANTIPIEVTAEAGWDQDELIEQLLAETLVECSQYLIRGQAVEHPTEKRFQVEGPKGHPFEFAILEGAEYGTINLASIASGYHIAPVSVEPMKDLTALIQSEREGHVQMDIRFNSAESEIDDGIVPVEKVSYEIQAGNQTRTTTVQLEE